jgi:hypothetical protein
VIDPVKAVRQYFIPLTFCGHIRWLDITHVDDDRPVSVYECSYCGATIVDDAHNRKLWQEHEQAYDDDEAAEDVLYDAFDILQPPDEDAR